MASETSDTKSTDSSASGSVSGSVGISTECLKASTGAKSKVWKYFRFTTNETGAVVNKTQVKCTHCKNDIQKTYRYYVRIFII